MKTPLLETRSIGVRHHRPLFSDVSFTVGNGEFVTLMGENGAGKTTLLKTLLGTFPLSSGEIRFFGKPANELDRAELHQNVTWVLSDREDFPPTLKIYELLKSLSRIYRNWDHNLETELIRAFQLSENAVLNHLSQGEMAKLKLIRAIAPRPQLIVCDELTANLSPDSKKQITNWSL